MHSVHSSMYNPQNQMGGSVVTVGSLRIVAGQSTMSAGYQAGSAAYNPGMNNYTAYQSQQYMQMSGPQQTMGTATNQGMQGAMPNQQSVQQIRPQNPNIQKNQILAPYIVRPVFPSFPISPLSSQCRLRRGRTIISFPLKRSKRCCSRMPTSSASLSPT